MQAFPKIGQFFRRLSIRYVRGSVCRYFEGLSGKKFRNPTVHAYQSYRKESVHAASKEKGPLEVQKLKSKPPHDEKESEEQMETGRAHQSLRDRRAIEKPEAVARHSEESQRRIARTLYFTDAVPFFP